jgi:hypothetical protein
VNYLIKIAKERGLPKLSASVLIRNTKMLAVFKRADVTPRMKYDGEVCELEFILNESSSAQSAG